MERPVLGITLKRLAWITKLTRMKGTIDVIKEKMEISRTYS